VSKIVYFILFKLFGIQTQVIKIKYTIFDTIKN
jgi:hypothetical protein